MKKIFIKICLIIGLLQGTEIIISPLFYGLYQPSGGAWTIKEDNVFLGGWGLISEINSKHFHIYTSAYNNRTIGLTKKPNFFSKEQGISWWKGVDANNNPNRDKFDFDISNIKIEYRNNNLNLFLGKFNRHWGPGESSLTISNKSPSFVQFGFNLDVNSKINFEYFHGQLRSLIIDSLNIDYYSETTGRNPEINRFIAAHRINFNPSKNLTIGASEMVVYASRGLDLMYCLPFAPFLSLQQYLGDLDNIQWSIDFNWNINKKTDLYGAFLIDEWMPSTTFDKNERNWFAYQLGSRTRNLLINNDLMIIEYNWTDHRIYRHRFPINDYYNHGYPIGFWAGPHAEELFFNYTFEKFDFIFKINYSNAKRGELTEEMLSNQYYNNQSNFKRYSNIHESISILEITTYKHIYKGLTAYLGLNFIDWKNGNFDPYNPSEQNLENTKKKTYSIGFSYNFDIKKQKAFINEKSIKLKYD
tara:strand:+ start:2075 stop:3490 length:1416 start_codon:yes stop_codon:yes gene_type:complete